MGCDIHVYVEARGANGKWECQDKVWKEADGEFRLYAQFGDCARKANPQYNEPAYRYINRDYILFSVLADVRNGSEDKTPFIDEARGLPEDVTPEVKEQSESMGEDGHSHSWLLLSEVLAWEGWDRDYSIKDFDDKAIPVLKTKPLREWCWTFWQKVIPAMKQLRDDPANVRMVFFFDN